MNYGAYDRIETRGAIDFPIIPDALTLRATVGYPRNMRLPSTAGTFWTGIAAKAGERLAGHRPRFIVAGDCRRPIARANLSAALKTGMEAT